MSILEELQSESRFYADLYGIKNNDERDAFRHAYSSAETARRTNKTIAWFLGDFREDFGFNYTSASYKDRFNNKYGANKISPFSKSKDDSAIMSFRAIGKNKLIVPEDDLNNNDFNYKAPTGSFFESAMDRIYRLFY